MMISMQSRNDAPDNMQPICIVDDSADQRLLLGYFLNQINPDFLIEFFEGAQALLDSLAGSIDTGSALPWMIILDLQMPKMDGFQALKNIKQSSKYNRIPVVICSSCQDRQVIQNCLDAGALDFLDKPVQLDKLKKLLTDI